MYANFHSVDPCPAREANSFRQELEIERILTAFKLNPYEVLEVSQEADAKEIQKVYRKKSLLIHPDKVKHGEYHGLYTVRRVRFL